MRFMCYTTLVLVAIILGSCNKTDFYEQKTKTLDSLSGAVNSIAKELRGIDTMFLEKSIIRFGWYKQFIQQNLNDTISKDESDNLQHFYTSGKNLENFSVNRKLILTRAFLINEQLGKLALDIKNKTLTAELLSRYSFNEKNEAAKLIEAGYTQQKIFHSERERFRNSLKGVELLIRSRNKGELPTIIRDTVSL